MVSKGEESTQNPCTGNEGRRLSSRGKSINREHKGDGGTGHRSHGVGRIC